MKRKIQLAFAFAILAMICVVGSAAAGSLRLASGSGSVGIDLASGTSLEELGSLPECSNLVDDDGDGEIDLEDSKCEGPLGESESGVPAGGGDPEDEGPGTSGPAGGDGSGGGKIDKPKPQPQPEPAEDDGGGLLGHRNPNGTPTLTNPSLTIANYGAAPIGVPNFVIDQFTIPPFLLPIYQACGTQYGIPWQVLASINRIETAFGTNLNVSSAGALGWMQFIPSTWEAYGVDANHDGRRDPYNPVDAICAAARYLKAAGGQDDLETAIFAYNHADWYVDEVLLYARQYGHIPDDLIGSLTGLTEGARFPVAADARYADDISEREAMQRSKPTEDASGNAADVVSSSPTRRGINIFTRKGASVIAVNDGVVRQIGWGPNIGHYVILEDAYGNRFTYGELGQVADVFPVAKDEDELTTDDFELISPDDNGIPQPTGETVEPGAEHYESAADESEAAELADQASAPEVDEPVNTEDIRERLYAYPERTTNLGDTAAALSGDYPGYDDHEAFASGVLRFNPKTMQMKPLREGSKVIAGTILGQVGGKEDGVAPHVNFSIRPTGRGAPKIDPKPILDGWKLLEATAIYRASGKNPFERDKATIGQVLLMSKEQLMKRVMNDPKLEIYSCGRTDVQTGQIDRRVLAMLEYLSLRGYKLTVTSLKCGHSYLTASGNVSQHSAGAAIDIATINGIPVYGNQGPGSITESLLHDILELQGSMTPDQVISLMDLGGPSFALPDHYDHVHVGFQPQYGDMVGGEVLQVLKPRQWDRLIERIAAIDNPEVPTEPSEYALPARDEPEDATASN